MPRPPAFVSASAIAVAVRRGPWRRWESVLPVVVRRVTDGALVPVPTTMTSDDGVLGLDLASSRIGLGEPLVGWIRWGRPRPRAEEVTVRLTRRIEISRRPGREHFVSACKVRFPAGDSELVMPFAVRVPAGAVPSFQSASHAHAWSLGVEAAGVSVRAPLEVMDAPEATRATVLSPAGPGDSGVAKLLGLGWSLAPGSDVGSVPGILWPGVRRQVGSYEVVLGLVHGAAEFPCVYARLLTPRLGFGLDVVPSSPLREFLRGDLSSGVPGWDRRYRATARDARGAAAHLAAIVPLLERLPPIVAWDDTHLELSGALDEIGSFDAPTLAEELVRLVKAHDGDAPAAGPYR
jgi:hypothetical protein